MSKSEVNGEGQNDVKSELALKDTSDSQDLSGRILDAFMVRAKELGVRAVSTDELAKVLSISKKTLYKQFRSKEEIVGGVLDRWEHQIKTELPLMQYEIPREFVFANVDRWYEIDAQFSTKFWEDVGQDYPALRKKYFDCMFDIARVVGSRVMPYMKPNLTRDFVREVYVCMAIDSAQPEFYEKAKVTRKQAVLMGVDVWLDGCFDLPEKFEN